MFVPFQSQLKHKTGSKDVTVVHILLFHKIRNTTELLKDPNELGCDNKHDTNGWVNLSVILIILITCIKMFLSRVVQKKKKMEKIIRHLSLRAARSLQGSRLWTVSWWLTNCTCGWLYFPGLSSRDWCRCLDWSGTVWIGIFCVWPEV